MVPPQGSAARSLPPPSLGDPALRRTLIRLVRRRVPDREVEDIVQDTLIDVLAAPAAPRDPRALRHWASGIARHKVVDFHRRASRESLATTGPVDARVEAPEPGALDLRKWAEGRLPPGDRSRRAFQWMLEESEGEKLEHLAERDRVAPATVRQQVARLRRHLRARWSAEVAVLVAAGVFIAAFFAGWTARRETMHDDPAIAPPPRAAAPSPSERAHHERIVAFDRCEAGDYRGCLDALDRAAALDPFGDDDEAARDLRRRAETELAPRPTPAPGPQGSPRRRPGYERLPGDTAPAAPHPCICTKGDPLCSCLAP